MKWAGNLDNDKLKPKQIVKIVLWTLFCLMGLGSSLANITNQEVGITFKPLVLK